MGSGASVNAEERVVKKKKEKVTYSLVGVVGAGMPLTYRDLCNRSGLKGGGN